MVKTDHGDFDIRPISFADRRELHRLEMKVYWDEKIDQDAYFNLLNWVMEKAFEDPEEKLKDLDDGQIDEILNKFYFHYKCISEKKPSK